MFEKTFGRGYFGSNPFHALVGANSEIEIIYDDTISILHRNSSEIDHSIMSEQSWVGGETGNNCYSFSY